MWTSTPAMVLLTLLGHAGIQATGGIATAPVTVANLANLERAGKYSALCQ